MVIWEGSLGSCGARAPGEFDGESSMDFLVCFNVTGTKVDFAPPPLFVYLHHNMVTVMMNFCQLLLFSCLMSSIDYRFVLLDTTP